MDDDYELGEVCCQTCDGLIAWVEPGDTRTFPRYCGGQWCKAFAPM
jgi:hypothetical protein